MEKGWFIIYVANRLYLMFLKAFLIYVGLSFLCVFILYGLGALGIINDGFDKHAMSERPVP